MSAHCGSNIEQGGLRTVLQSSGPGVLLPQVLSGSKAQRGPDTGKEGYTVREQAWSQGVLSVFLLATHPQHSAKDPGTGVPGHSLWHHCQHITADAAKAVTARSNGPVLFSLLTAASAAKAGPLLFCCFCSCSCTWLPPQRSCLH